MPGDASNFYRSDRVTVRKVTFKNQYQRQVAGNLFTPKNPSHNGKSPAIIVGQPRNVGSTGETSHVDIAGAVSGLRSSTEASSV